MKHVCSFTLLIGAVLLVSCEKKEPEHRWLKGNEYQRIDKVAEHLRGNDLVMWEVGYRHKELYDALKSKNTEYATYQLDKIILAMSKGSERRPKRKESYDWFIENAYPTMKKAITEKKDVEVAYQAFTANCVVCHGMEKVPFMPVAKHWESE